MKKLIALFGVVILTGAGCTTTGQVNTNVDEDTRLMEGATAEDPNSVNDVELDAELDAGIDLGNVEVGADGDVSVELTMSMDSGNFYFKPDVINAKPGQKVNVDIASNQGFHTFVIDDIGFSQTVEAGETITFTAPTKPGSYEFYCDIGDHLAKGMKGTLIVK